MVGQAGGAKEFERLSSTLEVKEHELRLLDERAATSLHGMRATQVSSADLRHLSAPTLRSKDGPRMLYGQSISWSLLWFPAY